MNEALKDMLTQDAIIAKQDMEASNIILGIDAANRYLLFGPNGQSLGIAAEESSGAGSWLIRQFLRNKRPCKVHIYDQKGQQIATGKKPFRFIFSDPPVIFLFLRECFPHYLQHLLDSICFHAAIFVFHLLFHLVTVVLGSNV